MRENLPKEMNFAHEARNAERAEQDFEGIRTSLYIRAYLYFRADLAFYLPIAKVIEARKRVLIMEYIRGGRVDDLQYLADNNIDRNKVSVELARIFAQMVHINGWFHAVCVVDFFMRLISCSNIAGSSSWFVSSVALLSLCSISIRQLAHPTGWSRVEVPLQL